MECATGKPPVPISFWQLITASLVDVFPKQIRQRRHSAGERPKEVPLGYRRTLNIKTILFAIDMMTNRQLLFNTKKKIRCRQPTSAM